MKRVIIESTNILDKPSDIEETLQKAVSALQSQRDNRPLKDPFLREQVENSDKVFDKVINHMIEEIEKVLS